MPGWSRGDSLRCIRLLALAASLIHVLSPQAWAADELQSNPFAASAFAGAYIPQSVSWNGSGTLSGLPFTAMGKLSSNAGWATGGALGYSLEDVPDLRWLNMQLIAGYSTSALNNFSGVATLAGLGSSTVPVPLSGSTHTFTSFVNFLIPPFGILPFLGTNVIPYLGIGPGFANSTAKLQSFTFAGTTLPANATSNETDFAFDAAAGADFAITPHWDLGIAYQYTWIDLKHLGGGASLLASSGASSSHTVGLFLAYRFGQAINR